MNAPAAPAAKAAEPTAPILTENPLRQAQQALRRIRKTARICMILPIPILLAATAVLAYFGERWLDEIYLALFLGLIYVFFAAGQILAILQMRRILPGIRNTEKAVQVLADAGDTPDLEALRQALLQKAPSGHLRDLLLRWIDLGLRGETVGMEALLDNAWERRSIRDNRVISIHVSLNRTTLKLGFLGTLIGIILTFPPMKRAVLSLGESEGELKFITDIAMAIDGDEYAILNTLIAIALSLLIEFVTIQIIERVLLGFDLVNSHINDWNLICLQPWIRKRYGAEAKLEALEERRGKLETSLMHAQKALESHLAHLTEAMRGSAAHLDQLAKLQAQVGRRVTELADYERQYRGFLAAKQQAAIPPNAAPREG